MATGKKNWQEKIRKLLFTTLQRKQTKQIENVREYNEREDEGKHNKSNLKEPLLNQMNTAYYSYLYDYKQLPNNSPSINMQLYSLYCWSIIIILYHNQFTNKFPAVQHKLY